MTNVFSPPMVPKASDTHCDCGGELDDHRCVVCGKSVWTHIAPWTSDLTFAALLLEAGRTRAAKKLAPKVRDWDAAEYHRQTYGEIVRMRRDIG
jgi:hypothetical protein